MADDEWIELRARYSNALSAIQVIIWYWRRFRSPECLCAHVNWRAALSLFFLSRLFFFFLLLNTTTIPSFSRNDDYVRQFFTRHVMIILSACASVKYWTEGDMGSIWRGKCCIQGNNNNSKVHTRMRTPRIGLARVAAFFPLPVNNGSTRRSRSIDVLFVSSHL